MAILLDLPAEVLCLTLDHLHDENVSLKNVSLTGNRALTAVAQNLMLRDLRICISFPVDKGHRFQPTFRRICNTPALRNAVRSITFKCRSNLANLDLMNLLQKNLGKLKSVTHVHIVCSAHSHASHDTCVTPTLLISVLRLPALHTLVVDNCLIDHYVIPESLCSRTLKVLVLDASTSKRVHYHTPDAQLPSLLDYMPAVSMIEMRGTEYQYDDAVIGSKSCLSSILERIVPGPKNDGHTRQPRTLHLGCNCHNASCLYSNVITPLSIALKSFKVLEELVFEKVVKGRPLHAAQHSFMEISVAGGGVLKRLSLNLWNLNYGDDTTWLCEALQRLSVLEEVTLECDGTDEALIACIAEHPSLRCVYFDVAPSKDVDIVQDLAQRIAGQARRLTCLAWAPAHVMAQIHDDHSVEMKVYEEPRWLQFRGEDTKWWEESSITLALLHEVRPASTLSCGDFNRICDLRETIKTVDSRVQSRVSRDSGAPSASLSAAGSTPRR
ncbi:hypothetical protein CPB85DRAFT_1477943 [Mucidula mucida]|nr:hypothetical protein CPB85DRAFT_1477943 [Mucidula mucida]